MYLQNELTFSLYLPKAITNTEDIETTAMNVTATNGKDIVGGGDEGANASNDNDITDVEGVEGNNVSEEQNDSVGDEV